MKMSYLHLNIVPRARRQWLPLLALLFAGVALVGGVSMPRFFEQFVHTIAMPLWSIRDNVVRATDPAFRSLASTETLLRENSALRAEVVSLRRENMGAHRYARENERLRALVGRGLYADGYVVATVIQGEQYSPYDSFVLDVGFEDGVREGMLVDTPEGHAIGFVARAFDKSSVVTLFSATGVRADVVLDSVREMQVQTLGYGAGTMRIELPRDAVVAIGDGVLLPVVTGSMVGVVSEIVSAREDAYQMVYVRPMVNSWELRYVRVDTVHTWKPAEEIQLSPREIPLAHTASTTDSISE